MTDVTGLENGTFSYVVTNQVGVVAVGSQNCYHAVTDVLAVQTTKPAAKA